ncbi:uncharacterized protein C8R40DRAFT_1086949, partial [Lentinula edodes]|uniref:uncharacterized protein n=1 Tax=Lentinula edodes TaxID=5353 RepID=UPI001E8D1819
MQYASTASCQIVSTRLLSSRSIPSASTSLSFPSLPPCSATQIINTHKDKLS